jgi:hypothetical protein
MQHIVAHVRSMYHSVVMPFAKHFPERTDWEGQRRYINTEASNTDTHVTLRVGSTVLSSRWRNTSLERRERFRRWRNVLSVARKRKDGQMLGKFYVTICMNAMQLQVQFITHFLPLTSGFHFHTHAFRSLLRIFITQPTVHITSVTSHKHTPQHGYNAVARQCGAGSYLLHTNHHALPTK